MKKVKGMMALLLVLSVFTGSIVTGTAATDTETSVVGDINGDGLSNMLDALVMYAKVASGDALEDSADFNYDGVVNMYDCLAFYSFLGLGNPLPEKPTTTTATTTTTVVNDKPLLRVSSVEATAGQQNIQVTVEIQNNPGVLGMTLTVNYDDKAFSLVSATNGSAVNGVLTLTKDKLLTSGCDFSWDGQEITQSQIRDGAVLVLTFAAENSIAKGNYPIDIVLRDAYDNDIAPLTIDVQNGNICID